MDPSLRVAWAHRSCPPREAPSPALAVGPRRRHGLLAALVVLAAAPVAQVAAEAPARLAADGVKGAVHDCVQKHLTSGTQRVACITERWEESLRGSSPAQPSRGPMTHEAIRAFVEACEDEHVLHPDDLETCVATQWKGMLAARASTAAPVTTAPAPLLASARAAPATLEHLSTPLRVSLTPRQMTLQLRNVDTGQEGLGVRGNVAIKAGAAGYRAYSGNFFIPSGATALTIELCPETTVPAVVADHWDVLAVKPRLEYSLAGKSSPRVACHEPGCEQPLGARLEDDIDSIADALCKAWDADAVRVRGTVSTPGLEAVPNCAGSRQEPECWLDFERGTCRVDSRKRFVHGSSQKPVPFQCPAEGLLKLASP